MPNLFCSIGSCLRELRRDEEGSILVLATLVIITSMGMIGLVLDGTRYFSLNNELQDLADAAAIAGAKELDTKADAITRATDQATNLLSNSPHWAQVGSSGLQIASVTFAGPSSPDVATTDPKWARFIRVTTVSRGVIPTFVRAVGATNNNMTTATAVAQSTTVACKTQPMMLCNPLETPTTQPNFTATPGQMFHLKPKGAGSTTFAPGDFGLVDPPGYTSSGANAIRDLLSEQSPSVCYANEVNPRTGHATNKVQEGINIRFDHLPNGSASGMDKTPAPNVIDAWKPEQPNCNKMVEIAGGVKLPRDPVLTPSGGVDIGNGPALADMDAYWQHHYAAAFPADLRVAPVSRYSAYLRELGLNGTKPTKVAGTEPAGPQCSTDVPVGDYKRRIISVSVVDCLYWNVHGNAVNHIWGDKYVNFFITEPSPDGSVFVEFIEVRPLGPGSGLHRIIQLVR